MNCLEKKKYIFPLFLTKTWSINQFLKNICREKKMSIEYPKSRNLREKNNISCENKANQTHHKYIGIL